MSADEAEANSRRNSETRKDKSMFIPRPIPPVVHPVIIPVAVVGAIVGWAAKSLWDVVAEK